MQYEIRSGAPASCRTVDFGKPALYRFRVIKSGILVTMAVGIGMSQESNPFSANPKAAEIGRGMFRIYCSPCHGIRAQGGRGPDLSRGVFAAGDRDSDLYRTILNGVAGSEMGSYSELGTEGIWRVITYIRSASRRDTSAVPGNAERGEGLFWNKGQCGRCHSVGIRGSRICPDLTRIGRQRSLDYLKTSILDPSDDITPGYAAITIVTRDGKPITGIERSLDNFSCQVTDLSGRYYSFQRDEVKSMKRETRSLMPSYAGIFSETELNDLLAYLVSRRGQEARP